jgi:hypothetical protein
MRYRDLGPRLLPAPRPEPPQDRLPRPRTRSTRPRSHTLPHPRTRPRTRSGSYPRRLTPDRSHRRATEPAPPALPRAWLRFHFGLISIVRCHFNKRHRPSLITLGDDHGGLDNTSCDLRMFPTRVAVGTHPTVAARIRSSLPGLSTTRQLRNSAPTALPTVSQISPRHALTCGYLSGYWTSPAIPRAIPKSPIARPPCAGVPQASGRPGNPRIGSRVLFVPN